MKKLLLVCVMAACGGGGPVSSSKEVKDLTPAEAESECDYLADNHPPRKVTCTENGQTATVTVGTDKSKCAGTNTDDVPDTCTATVGDAEDCEDAIYDLSDAEICSSSTPQPSACKVVYSDACSTDDEPTRTAPTSRLRRASLLVAR